MVMDLNVIINTEMTYAEAVVIFKALAGKQMDSDDDEIRKDLLKDMKEQLFIGE